jgi:membrane protein YdbS with pleckstrin-like domain
VLLCCAGGGCLATVPAMEGVVVRLTPSAKRYEDLQTVVGVIATLAITWFIVGVFFRSSVWGVRIAIGVSVLSVVLAVYEVLIANARLLATFTATVDDGVLKTSVGRILLTETSVRADAVLSVDLHSGPVLSRWGLARLELNGIATLPELPPLVRADALHLQRSLTRKAPSGDDD